MTPIYSLYHPWGQASLLAGVIEVHFWGEFLDVSWVSFRQESCSQKEGAQAVTLVYAHVHK